MRTLRRTLSLTRAVTGMVASAIAQPLLEAAQRLQAAPVAAEPRSPWHTLAYGQDVPLRAPVAVLSLLGAVSRQRKPLALLSA